MSFRKKLVILCGILLCLILTLFNALYINPFRIKVREEIFTSAKLPKAFDQDRVFYFSDLHYGMSNDEMLEELAEDAALIRPDLILFGGDLIDEAFAAGLSSSRRQKLVDSLSSMEAVYGKFAVLGEDDLLSDSTRFQTEAILRESGFDVLYNESRVIFAPNGEKIRLVGVASALGGRPDITAAYAADQGTFTITLVHCPDQFDDLPAAQTALCLAGHAHGRQIYFPFFEQFDRENGAKKYIRGFYEKAPSLHYVSNGVGTTDKSIRFCADAEVTVFRLQR